MQTGIPWVLPLSLKRSTSLARGTSPETLLERVRMIGIQNNIQLWTRCAWENEALIVYNALLIPCRLPHNTSTHWVTSGVTSGTNCFTH